MVTAVTLSFNVPDLLIRCVRSVLAQPEVTEYIIIENHSSTDMTSAYQTIRELCAEAGVAFIFHRPEVGMSFSEGQNWGLDNAKNDMVLLMNNDAYFLNANTLHTSLALISDSVKLVGHQILNEDRSVNHFGVFFDTTFRGAHMGSGMHADDPLFRRSCGVAAVTAACVLVARSHLRFDTAYWFEQEDTDFCLQHRRMGWQIICHSGAVVIHNESTTRGPIQSSNPEWIHKQQIGRAIFKHRWRWDIVQIWGQVFRYRLILGPYLTEHYSQVMADIACSITLIPVAIWLTISNWGAWPWMGLNTVALIAGFIVLKPRVAQWFKAILTRR